MRNIGTFFASSERFGVEGFLALAMALRDLAGKLALVRQYYLFGQWGHEVDEISARDVHECIIFGSLGPCRFAHNVWLSFCFVHRPDKWLRKRAVSIL